MRIVWTEAKLTKNGPGVLRKLLMLLQVDNKLNLTLVLRGENSENKLQEALALLSREDLFPISLLVQNLEGGRQYYSAADGGYKDNGVRTLQELVKREVWNRAKASPQAALDYTKYAMQRNVSFDMDDHLPKDHLYSTIRELFDYAFSVDVSYVRRACSDVDNSNISEALYPTTLFKLAETIINDSKENRKLGPNDAAFSSRVLEPIVEKLKEIKQPIPEGVLDYGIEQLQRDYRYDKVKDYALAELVKCYRQSKSSSITEEVKPNVEVVQ